MVKGDQKMVKKSLNYSRLNLLFIFSSDYRCNTLTMAEQNSNEPDQGNKEMSANLIDQKQDHLKLTPTDQTVPMDIDLGQMSGEQDLEPCLGFDPAPLDLDPRGKIQDPGGQRLKWTALVEELDHSDGPGQD